MTINLDDKLNLVAIYAAALSTINLVWQIWLWWRTGPRLIVSANANMKSYGSVFDDDNTYIAINVSNNGSTKTSITHVVIFVFDSKYHRFFGKPRSAAVVPNPGTGQTLPHVLDVGCTFMALIKQDAKVEEWSRTGCLYVGVHHSARAKPELAHVRPIVGLPPIDED